MVLNVRTWPRVKCDRIDGIQKSRPSPYVRKRFWWHVECQTEKPYNLMWHSDMSEASLRKSWCFPFLTAPAEGHVLHHRFSCEYVRSLKTLLSCWNSSNPFSRVSVCAEMLQQTDETNFLELQSDDSQGNKWQIQLCSFIYCLWTSLGSFMNWQDFSNVQVANKFFHLVRTCAFDWRDGRLCRVKCKFQAQSTANTVDRRSCASLVRQWH